LSRRIAVLGAGIMGTSLALFLARRGFPIDLFDSAPTPLAGASRWNEGKIHLGYLYGADPSLATARRVIPGGLRFAPLVSELIGEDIGPRITPRDDILLFHRDSVVSVDALAKTFDRVSTLVRAHPEARHYLVDAAHASCRALGPEELAPLADPGAIVAGFATPERSVDTQWLADRLCDALSNQPGINLRPGITVSRAAPVNSADGPWQVAGTPDVADVYDVVVNALWHGRLAIDLSAGLDAGTSWSHRYRLALFVRTGVDLDLPSAMVGIGPFGDVKSYGRRRFYLSWYPAGLRAESHEVVPPVPEPVSAEGRARIVADMRDGLAGLVPWTEQILDAAEEIRVEGGFVFAQGQGLLSDPNSTQHRRDRFGVRRKGRYFSIDTGKYSTAPALAADLARTIAGD
jgi:hypothetical protein